MLPFKFLAIGGLLWAFLSGEKKPQGGDDKPVDDKPEDKPVDKPADEGPVFKAKPVVEQMQCVAVSTDRPLEWEGRKRQAGEPLGKWLAWVAYRKTYPEGPVDTVGGTEWDDARARLQQCIDIRLKAGGFDVKQDPVELPSVSDAPKPSSYYRIKYGDTLLGLTKKVYGKTGSANLAVAQKVNNSPYNKRLHREAPEGEVQNGYWSERIHFLPKFGNFAQQFADATTGSYGAGHEYAVLFLPPASEVT